MAHDDGPAPATTFLRRLACAAMLLVLALPLFAQSRDPAVLTQDLLAKCQEVFISCGKACFGEMCKVCEEARDLCKAEVHSDTGVPEPRSPYGWSLPPGMGIPIMIPPIPGISNSTTPRPYPSPNIPVLGPITPDPMVQPAARCDPKNFPQIVDRYNAEHPQASSADALLADFDGKQTILDKTIAGYKETVADVHADRAARDEAESNLAAALRKKDLLNGARKVVEGMASSSWADPSKRDPALIGIGMTIDVIVGDIENKESDRLPAKGFEDPGSVVDKAVGADARDSDIIHSAHTSYGDKEQAMARILEAYGRRGSSTESLWDLSYRTGHDALIATCRAEKMHPPGDGSSSADSKPCKGESYDPATQCCCAEGIGTRTAKNWVTISFCPPERRAPKLNYHSSRNGCGVPLITGLTGDMPDNPNFHIVWTSKVPPKAKLVYFGPSFLPACDFHDDCWGTCNTPETGTSDDRCNSEFGNRLHQICVSANLTGDDLADCQSRAESYRTTVSRVPAVYSKSQAKACDCCEGSK